MDRFVLLSLVVAVSLGMAFIAFPDGAAALLVVLIPSLIAIGIFRHYAKDADFVTRVFLAGLLVRLGFGIFVHVFDLRGFFGGDANTYDFRGIALADQWMGLSKVLDTDTILALRNTGSGWGMNYLVGAIYLFVGRNILAAQSFCAVVGAATAPMVYFCASKVFNNESVARWSAGLVAFFPAFVIWSGQLLKDGLIIFLLVLAMTMVLQLQERFNYAALLLLALSLGGILTLRFYIFYMVAIAVAGSFVIGISNSVNSVARRTIVVVLLGLGMTYFGVTRNATVEFNRYGSLERLQNARLDQSRTGESGFAEDVDVSTTEGALSIVPIGLIYLMLAPFPWEAASLRQAITLPEVLIWWAMMPFMIWGIWWAIRNKLRSAFPILLFSLMLTLAYSVFQGNVGTAYRQRTQILVFLFIFIAVGWQLLHERRQDKRLVRLAKERRVESALRARIQQN